MFQTASFQKRRRISVQFSICVITLAILLPAALSAALMRMDGDFKDWKDVKPCATDPKADAKAAFDITKVYAASRDTVLYLRFDTTSLLNLQNGPDTEGTLLILIDLPDSRRLTLDTRGRRAYLNGDQEARIPWDRLSYIVGPTHAQNEFEIQVDLSPLGVKRTDSIQIQFDGSDQLASPIEFKFSKPADTPKRRSPRRDPETDARIVSFNTYYEGLSDPNREAQIRRILNSVNGDVYCFQEEWKTEAHARILNHLMPLKNENQWRIHKVSGNVIASRHPLTALPSKNTRYALARIEFPQRSLYIINVHLSAMGYIDSREDRLRVQQANDITAAIDEINTAARNEDHQPAIVIVGDFNLVGSRTPLDTILAPEKHGLKNWLLPNLVGESIITWRGGSRSSFAPGKLDYLVYTAATLKPQNGFLLDSSLLNEAQCKQLRLYPSDSNLSDHLMITADFQFDDIPNK